MECPLGSQPVLLNLTPRLPPPFPRSQRPLFWRCADCQNACWGSIVEAVTGNGDLYLWRAAGVVLQLLFSFSTVFVPVFFRMPTRGLQRGGFGPVLRTTLAAVGKAAGHRHQQGNAGGRQPSRASALLSLPESRRTASFCPQHTRPTGQPDTKVAQCSEREYTVNGCCAETKEPLETARGHSPTKRFDRILGRIWI